MVRRLRSWGPCLSRVSCCFLRLETLAHFVSFLSRLIHFCCSHGCTMRRVFLWAEEHGLISQTVAGNQAYLCYKHWDKVGLLLKCCRLFFTSHFMHTVLQFTPPREVDLAFKLLCHAADWNLEWKIGVTWNIFLVSPESAAKNNIISETTSLEEFNSIIICIHGNCIIRANDGRIFEGLWY